MHNGGVSSPTSAASEFGVSDAVSGTKTHIFTPLLEKTFALA